jgi:hypothetical protein
MMTAERRRRRNQVAQLMRSRCRRDEHGNLIFEPGRSEYGWIRNEDGVPERVHRFSWRVSRRRRIPASRLVTHRCSIKRCVEPRCLRLGDHRSNALDAVAAGVIARGEDHPNAVLTSAQVIAIRSSYAAERRSQADIATAFNIARSTVGGIVRGEQWRHLLERAN